MVGVFGGVSAWLDVWGFVLDYQNFIGVEMLGWRGTRNRIKQYEAQGIHVTGIHGQTGGANETKGLINKSMMTAINGVMDSPQELATCPTDYLLFHVRSKAKDKVTPSEGKVILVENDLEKDSLKHTRIAIRRLKKKGIKAGMMFDLVHYLRAQYGFVDLKHWDRLLSAVERNAPMGVHIPIGLHMSDSLPFEQISLGMWRELGAVLSKVRPSFRTIENQMQRQYSFILPRSERAGIQARNERIIDLLTNAGVL